MERNPENIKCIDCVHYAHVVTMILTGDRSYKTCIECCTSEPVGKNYEPKEKNK